MEYEIIIPIAESDYSRCKTTIVYISKFIKNKQIWIISKKDLKEKVLYDFHAKNGGVKFIDENAIMPNLTFDKVFEHLHKYKAEKRAGWYFQQFIKMGYSHICKSDYYLSWDADTIPIRNISMFSNGRPIFDTKTEYHKPYFDTIYNLLGLKKIISRSYISEHMIFNKKIMNNIINQIAKNGNNEWYINILDSISREELALSGFSEFETYGTYVETYLKGKYIYRDIDTLRNGKKYFSTVPSDEILEWLAKDYACISFEKWDINQFDGTLPRIKFVREHIRPKEFINYCDKYVKSAKILEKLQFK